MSLRLVGLVCLFSFACSAPPAPSAPAPATTPSPAARPPEPPREEPPPAPPEPSPEPAACSALALPELAELPSPTQLATIPVEDEHDALASFHEKVAALLRGERKTPLRVLVYGDSNITADWITGGLRRTLQQKLGDAGHGFIALGSPWPGYVHMDVKHRVAQPGWAIHAVSTKPIADHRYGFAGITVQSTGPNARTWIETASPQAPVGHRVSRVGIHFLRGPGLGAFRVLIDGQPQRTIQSEAQEYNAGHALLEVPDGPHRITFETSSRQPVRLFGATMERDLPGIVIDSAGVAASVTATMIRQDAAIVHQTLQQRAPDLVILAHGTFDVAPWNKEEQHEEAMRTMIARHREALPGVAILVVSPVDYRGPINDTRGSPALAAQEKRALAKKNQAAFWDLRAAMGGDRSIRNFRIHHMADPDHIHLNEKGGLLMGNRLALALWGSLRGYLQAHPTAGCPAAGSPPPGR